jgi:hypothetical protein
MEYLKFTPELANNWKNALSMGSKTHLLKRVLDSMNQSQLESKLWIIQELINLEIEPKRVAILAGWYAQYIVPLLYDNFESLQFAENYEIDQDVKRISYAFNKRLKDDKKYVITIKNVMFDRIHGSWQHPHNQLYKLDVDTIINCACEHMYPMWKFRELNKPVLRNPIYVLQSSDDDQYSDHINCVNSEEELIDQAGIKDVMYSGAKFLSNKSTRFMVIGR